MEIKLTVKELGNGEIAIGVKDAAGMVTAAEHRYADAIHDWLVKEIPALVRRICLEEKRAGNAGN